MLSLLALSFASSCGSDSTGSDDPAARPFGRPGAGIRVGSDHGRTTGGWVAPGIGPKAMRGGVAPGISPKAMRGGVAPGISPKAIAAELGIDADAFIGAQQTIHDEKKAEYVVAIAAELGISTATLQQAIDDAQAERKAQSEQALTERLQQAVKSGRLTQDKADEIRAKIRGAKSVAGP